MIFLFQGRTIIPGEKIRIKIEKGASSLTLENITADQAGKYAAFVENVVGQDCRYSSVAVEGKQNNYKKNSPRLQV